MKREKEAFAKAAAICKALPGVTERISWGHPNWLVGGKMFAGVGPGHGGPHLVFKVADRSIEKDERFKPVSSIGAWKGYDDWYLYFFDWDREDDWDHLKQLLEVSWELLYAKLSKKKQAEVMAPIKKKRKSAAPVRKRKLR